MADANWKKRIGIDIKYSSSDEDGDEWWFFFTSYFYFASLLFHVSLLFCLWISDWKQLIVATTTTINTENVRVLGSTLCGRRGFALNLLLLPFWLCIFANINKLLHSPVGENAIDQHDVQWGISIFLFVCVLFVFVDATKFQNTEKTTTKFELRLLESIIIILLWCAHCVVWCKSIVIFRVWRSCHISLCVRSNVLIACT